MAPSGAWARRHRHSRADTPLGLAATPPHPESAPNASRRRGAIHQDVRSLPPRGTASRLGKASLRTVRRRSVKCRFRTLCGRIRHGIPHRLRLAHRPPPASAAPPSSLRVSQPPSAGGEGAIQHCAPTVFPRGSCRVGLRPTPTDLVVRREAPAALGDLCMGHIVGLGAADTPPPPALSRGGQPRPPA